MGPNLISGNYLELVQPWKFSTQRWFDQQKKTGKAKEWGKETEVTITSLSVQVHKRKE